jgi:hypothetical protein
VNQGSIANKDNAAPTIGLAWLGKSETTNINSRQCSTYHCSAAASSLAYASVGGASYLNVAQASVDAWRSLHLFNICSFESLS